MTSVTFGTEGMALSVPNAEGVREFQPRATPWVREEKSIPNTKGVRK
jgi:hypothetical protein